MDRASEMLARLDEQIGRHGKPTCIALARHTWESWQRFHPAEPYHEGLAQWQALRDGLAKRGLTVVEVPAEQAPPCVTTPDALARWAESRAGWQPGEPYRLGLWLGSYGLRNDVGLGWFILGLR